MEEEELKEMLGDDVFKTLSAEKVSALLSSIEKKQAPKKDDPKPDPKPNPSPAPKDDPEPPDDLRAKAKRDREQRDSSESKTKEIENSLKFNINLKNYIDENKELLPKEVEEIIAVSEKENYDSAIQKARSLQDAFIQSFFSIEDNKELLTASQKTSLEDYLKLTKNGREEKAGLIYENLFEPAIETLRKVKKAEELGKARGGRENGSDVENAYKERLMKNSRKFHLGEKTE